VSPNPTPNPTPSPVPPPVRHGWPRRAGWGAGLLAGLGLLVLALLAGGAGTRAEVASSNRWTLLAGLWFGGLAVWAWFLPAARALLVAVAAALALVTFSGLTAGGPFPSNVAQLFGVPLLVGVGLIAVVAVPPTAGGTHRPLPGLLRGTGIALAVVVAVLVLVTVLGIAGL